MRHNENIPNMISFYHFYLRIVPKPYRFSIFQKHNRPRNSFTDVITGNFFFNITTFILL